MEKKWKRETRRKEQNRKITGEKGKESTGLFKTSLDSSSFV